MRALLFAAAIGLAGFISSSSDSISRAATLQQTSDPGIQAKGAIGEVKSIDAASKLVTIKTDAGSVVMVLYTDRTTYKKLAPGEQSLTSATDITFAEVAEGDRIWARGTVAEDRKSVSAQQIVVMSKGDIAKKQEAERLEWRRRGILGVISTLKAESKEITITSRTMVGTQSVIIPVSDKTEMRRYAPDSIKFSDAKASSFGELKVGDQLRALGDRAADGTHFTPQKVVTGSFRTVAGTVTAVDPATREIKIKDLEKKQALTIIIKNDAVLRKFPPASELGAMMGGGSRPAGGPGGPAPQGGQPQGNPPKQGGPGGPNGPRGGGGGPNINDMLERLPIISVADVKVGDTIIVSSTQGVDPTRLTAIALVSGADTLLTMLAPRPQPGQSAPNPAAGLGSGISFGIGLP
ncbi:MAG TPA: hypothetical protein VGQ39_04000 [Pyrinomonadaceae bacterium]|jgi:hypothetical protein|nr:hypothetical protein [Pyrinomonadaceae bacterium]